MCIIACDYIVLSFVGHAVLRSRKLMIILRKEEEDDEKDRYRYDLKGEKKQEHSTDHGHDHQTYPDLLDIAGMDYSPAKRKPPIHN